MPYSDRQKREHIFEIQKYLYSISLSDKNISPVFPSGIYDGGTVSAVKSFQEVHGLEVSGCVDCATWDEIVKNYKEIFCMKPEKPDFFPSENYVCGSGEESHLVAVIQAILCSISKKFDNFPEVRIDGIFSDETEAAVKNFQLICGISESGKVDSVTWKNLCRFP